MLQLINIKRDGMYISANYLPEGYQEPGFIKIDLNTSDIAEVKKAEGFGLTHAIRSLLRLSKLDELPETYTESWY